MKKRIMHLSGIVALAFVALAAALWGQGNFSLPLSKALAQGDTDGVDFVVWQKITGVTATQVIRISVAKGNSREEQPIELRCVVSDQAGVVVFTPTHLMVGDFDSIDISYADLNIIAEPGTGRKQVMLQVIESRRGRRSSSIVGAMEIINQDGTTAVYDRFGDFL
jgi:hypothetical protein